MLHKSCRCCGKEKEVSSCNFKSNSACTDGFEQTCLVCKKHKQKMWRIENKEKISEKKKSEYILNKDIVISRQKARMIAEPYRYSAQSLAGGVLLRSKKFGYHVDPELRSSRYIEQWLFSQRYCECCNVEFLLGKKGTGKPHNRSPSLDRFDTSIGYTISNTALVCWKCNNVKINYHENDLRKVADWMERRRLREIIQPVLDDQRPTLSAVA